MSTSTIEDIINDINNSAPAMPFGKYRDQSMVEVASKDPRYFAWFKTTDWAREPGRMAIINDAIQTARQAKLDAAAPLTLTPHQEDRAAVITTALARHNVVRLEGGAGYGKSYVTQKIARDLMADGYTVAATAVSYVATQVLAAQLDAIGVMSATLARTLRFEKKFIDGKETYEHSVETRDFASAALAPRHALIVDECSMINDRDASLLMKTAARRGGKLILVGDSAQLPPVKQEHLSACCTEVDPGAVSVLTVPMRYPETSALYSVEQTARHDPRAILNSIPGSDEVTLVPDSAALIREYVNRYREDPAALHRMLLFRRGDVVRANNAIRKALFGEDARAVEDDEQLMIMATSDTPYLEDDRAEAVRYYSGQTFRVIEMSVSDYRIVIAGKEHNIPHFVARLDDGRPAIRIMFSVSENQADTTKLGGAEFSSALAAARAEGLAKDQYGNLLGSWELWKRLQQDFVRVAYTYATTTHRAQGQTCDYAYCHPRSLLSIPGLMGNALAYVAMTRARKHLTLMQ